MLISDKIQELVDELQGQERQGRQVTHGTQGRQG